MSTPAAWHPDPLGRHELRYWDGAKWTEHVSNAGATSIDPLDDGDEGSGQNGVEADASAPVAEGGATSTPSSSQSTAPAPPAPAASPAGQFDQALATVATQAANRIATSALIVGIIALVFSVIPLLGAIVGFPLGGFAVIAGIIGFLASKKSGQGRGASIAGLILGGLAVAVAAFQAIVLGRLADEFSVFLGLF